MAPLYQVRHSAIRNVLYSGTECRQWRVDKEGAPFSGVVSQRCCHPSTPPYLSKLHHLDTNFWDVCTDGQRMQGAAAMSLPGWHLMQEIVVT